ncbi:MAG: endonuclease III [Bacillota bacterium]
MNRELANRILDQLAHIWPDPRPALQYRNPFELLVATILSAQSTDEQVNKLTPALFARFPNAQALARAGVEEVEEYIKGCGLYHNKARHLVAMARQLVEKYGGQVPDQRKELESLPGVGRKTANVVLNNAFGQPALAVDTHVFRVANRLGLARADNVRDTEEQLMALLPRERWGQAHHWLIFLGRTWCKARRPRCQECPVALDCQFPHKLQ